MLGEGELDRKGTNRVEGIRHAKLISGHLGPTTVDYLARASNLSIIRSGTGYCCRPDGEREGQGIRNVRAEVIHV